MWVSFGWEITLTYIVIAAGVSLLASLLLDKLGFERYVIEPKGTACSKTAAVAAPIQDALAAQSTCCTAAPVVADTPIAKTSCCTAAPAEEEILAAKAICCNTQKPVSSCATANTKNDQGQAKTALNYRLAGLDAWQQFKDVLTYLAIGVLLGSFIYGFVPAEWIAKHAGSDNPFAVPLSAVIGIPLYIRAEAVIPLASSLLGKGMGIGAVMALIIGSAGASLTEVILLKSMFKTPMIVAFLTVILGMAVMMGYLVTSFF